jgi:hypothetical protein
MTLEEKQLLIKDICARLPYRINVLTEDNDKGHIIGVDETENGVFEIHIIEDGDSYTCDESIENFKPYLRSMSSMTEEENLEFVKTTIKTPDGYPMWTTDSYDWLNVNHFDYRGLIPMGLALEAKEGMYKTE